MAVPRLVSRMGVPEDRGSWNCQKDAGAMFYPKPGACRSTVPPTAACASGLPYPISIAVAVQDYIAPDCRFMPIQRGQVVYVFSKLKGRGRLFWGGSVQGDYYGEHPARLGFFPSSVVQESQYLKPGKVEVKTDQWDFSCQ
ncbi:melanoma-derived growth regulatory protein isoform X1 [Chelonia mydas]|uniref:melanoma-derived growth regulatory protein isoform X1 n=1 Tax=Chelonia mydas TaxID=8469 RepID=UPI0018A1EC8F|nr:melanoma-derived growth regulatory protein isoform X1 [Chelonia mydas]